MVFMWCVLPPRNTACNPFGVDVEATQARQGCPSTPLPLLVEAAQNVRGVASHAKGPGARASGVPPPPATAPSPHVVSVDTLTDCGLCPPPLALGGSGFTSKGGHAIPPPGPTRPTTPTGKPNRGISMKKIARATYKGHWECGSPRKPPPEPHRVMSGWHPAPLPSCPS